MALSQYYVDPSIAANSGTGTIGDPYGDLQYALNSITRNATSGDQINVKAGTDEVLGAALTLATYGTPSTTAPLVIRGYTSAANDGGIGGISGNGTYAMFAATYASLILIDLHMHNTGSATVVTVGNLSLVFRCEVDNTTGGGVNLGGLSSVIANCYVHNCGAVGISSSNRGCMIYGCYLKNGTNDFTIAIQVGEGAHAVGNIVDVDGSTIGIQVTNDVASVIGNTVFGNAAANSGGSTATGIDQSFGGTSLMLNNIVSDWSGSGAEGIDYNGHPVLSVNNALYNNTTGEASTADVIESSNNTLGASPFVNAASGDFDINGTVTNVTEAAWPSDWPGLTTSTTPLADLGAVQAGAGAGGSSVYRRVARLLGG